MTTIATGQKYRDTSSGNVVEITKIVGSFVYMTNLTDGFEGAQFMADLTADLADGTLIEVTEVTPIDATPAQALALLAAVDAANPAPVPQIGDRVRVTAGPWAGHTGTVKRAAAHTDDRAGIELDNTMGRTKWIRFVSLEILPAN